MRSRIANIVALGFLCTLSAVVGLVPSSTVAQDRLPKMPGYDQHEKMAGVAQGSVKLGEPAVTWLEGGKAIEYAKDGRLYRYDTATAKTVDVAQAADDAGKKGKGFGKAGGKGAGKGGKQAGGMKVARGRQEASAPSPDGKLKAFYRAN